MGDGDADNTLISRGILASRRLAGPLRCRRADSHTSITAPFGKASNAAKAILGAAGWLELIVVHADERGLQRQTRCLLGGARARGGDVAFAPTGQGHFEIVYFAECARTG
jgi:hypothetical protein